MSGQFCDKAAIITGAASATGRSGARLLGELGARVPVAYGSAMPAARNRHGGPWGAMGGLRELEEVVAPAEAAFVTGAV